MFSCRPASTSAGPRDRARSALLKRPRARQRTRGSGSRRNGGHCNARRMGHSQEADRRVACRTMDRQRHQAERMAAPRQRPGAARPEPAGVFIRPLSASRFSPSTVASRTRDCPAPRESDMLPFPDTGAPAWRCTMNDAATLQNDSLIVEIPYTLDTGAKLVNETFGPDSVARRRTGTPDPRPMPVGNGRLVAGELSLDTHGFIFVGHKTAVTDFFDREQLETVYRAEVETFIKAASGAARVVMFDYTLRSGNDAEREARLIREPVLSAHNDYTE